MICKGCLALCKLLINKRWYRFGHSFNDLDAESNDQVKKCVSLVE